MSWCFADARDDPEIGVIILTGDSRVADAMGVKCRLRISQTFEEHTGRVLQCVWQHLTTAYKLFAQSRRLQQFAGVDLKAPRTPIQCTIVAFDTRTTGSVVQKV